MARLNLEDRWFDDPRRLALIEKIGAIQTDGSAVQIFRMAQSYFKQNVANPSIPYQTFARCPNALLFIEIGLAEVIDGFVYVRGSREHFEWIRARKVNGSKGGLARASKAKQKLAKHSKSNPQSQSQYLKEEEYMSESENPESPIKPNDPPNLKALWNENSSPLPTVREVTDKRRSAWAARWRAVPERAYWVEIIRKIAASPFCQGGGKQGWVANVDYLLQPDTHVKISEGQYGPSSTQANPNYEVKDAL